MSEKKRGPASFYKYISHKRACRFVVKVRTPTQRSAPLSELFFCDHPECLKTVHPHAARRSIENYFCPQCLSTYPSNIVRKFTRCPKCIMCPACFTTCEKILLMRSNTYLLQCTFCYWLSGPVDIKAKTAMDLVNKVKEANHNAIQALREEMFQLVKHYRKNTEQQPSYLSKSNYLFRGTRGWWRDKKKKRPKKRQNQAQKIIQEQGDNFPAVMATNYVEPCDSLDKSLEEKRAKQHDLPKEAADNSWVKPAPPSFVTDISLKRVTSLIHRLEDPMRQPTEFDKLHPQRLRLMTKESFRCPNSKCKNAPLCKPVIGARHCSFEIKKLALDYMPHIRMDGPIGSPDLPPKTPSKVYLFLANPLSDPVKIRVQPRPDDPYTNADVTCSSNAFELEHRDTSAKVVWPSLTAPRKQVESGDFTSQNMVGIVLTVTPRYWSSEAIEIVLDVTVECQITCSDAVTRKVLLDYPIEIAIKPPPPAKASTKVKSPRSKRGPSSRRTSGATTPKPGLQAAQKQAPKPSSPAPEEKKPAV